MNVTFATVTKRRNSTKLPTGGASYDVVLKDDSSVSSPVLALKWPGSGSPVAYNSAYIPAYGRYYWIDNWTYSERQWIASCSVDVLASFRTEIGASSKYVLRAASEYDPDVIDTLYPVKMPVHAYNMGAIGIAWATSFENGRFVVGIVGQGNTFSVAGAGYVVLNATQFQQIIDACFTETEALWPASGSLGNDIGEALAAFGRRWSKSIINPIQYINSITWVPFIPTTSGSTTVHLGPVNTGITAATLGSPLHNDLFRFSTPQEDNGPDAWMNQAPFVSYVCRIPPFPDIQIDASLVTPSDTMQGRIECDVTSGEAYIYLYSQGSIIRSAAGRLGIPIQLSGTSVNYAGGINQLAGSVGGIVGNALAGNVAGAIAGGVSSIGSVAGAFSPQATNGGYGGGLAAIAAPKQLVRLTYEYPELDITEQGRPLCKIKTISSLSGFILCRDGDVEAPARDSELAQIAAFLTGGFFYE